MQTEISYRHPSPWLKSLAWLCLTGLSLPATAATVTATIVADRADVETAFTLDMAGRTVSLLPNDITTDGAASADGYAITLSPERGFALSGIACTNRADGSLLAANVNLDAGGVLLTPGSGAVIDCVFSVRAQLATVIAMVTTDVPDVEMEFTIEMGAERVELLPGEYATDKNARADLYRMALLRERGFQLEDIACVRTADDERLPAEVDFENQSIAFAPGAGESVRCTFQVNTLRAAVTATIVTNRDAVETPFQVEMNGNAVTLYQGNTATDSESRPDLYRMALLPVRDFRLMDIVCLREGYDGRLPAQVDFTNQSIAFAPGDDSHVDCTFSLQALRARVSVTVNVVSDLPPLQFTLDMGSEVRTVLQGKTIADEDANSELYRITLRAVRGYRLTDIACIRATDGKRVAATTVFENQSIGFAPGEGGNVDCTFTLDGGSTEMLASGTSGGVTIDPDGRPRITLPGVAVGVGTGSSGGGTAGNAIPQPTVSASCCSCTNLGSSLVPASSITGPSEIPCDFDIPAHWTAQTGNDGALVSVVTGAECGGTCTTIAPTISLSFGTSSNSNADMQESIWEQVMPVVGSGRCGEGSARFFRPPGVDTAGQMGGVRFHVMFGGEKYGGNANFSCNGPGEWIKLQELFIGSFRANPNSSFP